MYNILGKKKSKHYFYKPHTHTCLNEAILLIKINVANEKQSHCYKIQKPQPALVLVESTLYTPVQSAGHEGQAEWVRPVVELLQEAVHQLGSLAEETLLQRGDAFALQRPQQFPPAKEGLVAEEAAQSCVLGHHVGC